MATNTSLEEQKKKLHLVLMSKRDGYTNTAHILRDLRDDFGHDGIAMARAYGYHSFQTFLESASMREYCRCAEELRTTTVYYGIGTEQTEHIEREMQISLAAKLEKAMKEIRNLRRQLEAKKSLPNESPAQPDISANLASEKTDAQRNYKDQDEKAVQTEDPTMHEIYATFQFLKEPYAKGQTIDRRKDPKLLYNDSGRTVPLQYYGNMTVKEIIAQIFSKYPMDNDIHKYETHTVRYFDPGFDGRVEISNDISVVPNGKYFIDMNLRAPTPHEIVATLKFLKEPHAKGQIIDRNKDSKLLYSCTRTVPLQYYGNMTVKEMIGQIFSKYPMDDDIHKYESHTVRYFHPTFNGRIDVRDDISVVSNGKYFIDMNLRAPTPHEIVATLKFLKEPHAKGQPIDRHKDPKFLYNWVRAVPHQYYGNMTVKELIIELFSKHPPEDEIHNYESHCVRYFDPKFDKWVEVSDDISVVPNGEYCVDMNLLEDNVPHKIFATLKYLSVYFDPDEIIDVRLNQFHRYSSSTTLDVPYKGSIKVKDILAKICENNPTDEKYRKLKNYYSYRTLYLDPYFNGKDYVNVSGEDLAVPNGKYIFELQLKPSECVIS